MGIECRGFESRPPHVAGEVAQSGQSVYYETLRALFLKVEGWQSWSIASSWKLDSLKHGSQVRILYPPP